MKSDFGGPLADSGLPEHEQRRRKEIREKDRRDKKRHREQIKQGEKARKEVEAVRKAADRARQETERTNRILAGIQASERSQAESLRRMEERQQKAIISQWMRSLPEEVRSRVKQLESTLSQLLVEEEQFNQVVEARRAEKRGMEQKEEGRTNFLDQKHLLHGILIAATGMMMAKLGWWGILLVVFLLPGTPQAFESEPYKSDFRGISVAFSLFFSWLAGVTGGFWQIASLVGAVGFFSLWVKDRWENIQKAKGQHFIFRKSPTPTGLRTPSEIQEDIDPLMVELTSLYQEYDYPLL